jgi:CHAT domain-containing protein
MTQHNLANVYSDRLNGERANNLELAISHYEAALTVYTRLPRNYLATADRLGRVLLESRDWVRASQVLAEARSAFMLLFGQGLDEVEAHDLIETAGTLFANLAYANAALGIHREAFAIACEGKARLLATALRLQRLDLPPPRRQRLEVLRTGIREQSRLLDVSTGPDRVLVLDRLGSMRRELSGLIEEGEARLGEADALAMAQPLLASGGAIVVPLVTAVGGKLLLATAGPVLTVLDVPQLTSQRLNALMQGAEGRTGWLAAFRDVPDRRPARRLIESIGEELWSLFAGPLAAALGQVGVPKGSRLMVLPTGALGFLPLGLAQDPASGRRLIEEYEIVYGPSLKALVRAHELAARPIAPSLAAIVNPTRDLAFAPIEGMLVAAEFGSASKVMLDQETATPEAALTALMGRSYWHFATHGRFDFEAARHSALAMKEGTRLTVGTLLETEDLGRPRLVVLSACESGLHDIDRTPEEFVGLPGAFMTVGATAVLGTLWPVDDLASTLLTARFYELHLRQRLAPPAALRQAQLWLRDVTRADLAEYVHSAVAQGRLDGEQGRLLEHALGLLPAGSTTANGAEMHVADRFFDLEGADGPPDAVPEPRGRSGGDRPFDHPIFWGGFVLTGM